MMKYPIILLTTCLLALGLVAQAQETSSVVDNRSLLQQSIESLNISDQMVGNERLQNTSGIKSFFRNHSYKNAWTDGQKPRPQLTNMLNCTNTILINGLNPGDYHFEFIEQIMAYASKSGKSLSQDDIVAIEILATDAFLLLAKHFHSGKLDPTALVGVDWHHQSRTFDMPMYLLETIKEQDICHALERLLPIHEGYHELVNIMQTYLQTNWEPIEADPKIFLQRDAEHPLVKQIKQRLKVTGDLRQAAKETEKFDWELESAIVRYQQRHGLLVDGYIKGRLIETLNIPPKNRINQIRMNLERWKWLPDDFGTDYVAVNIPGFELTMMVNDEVDYRERIIVGLERWPTPAFHDTINYLVINPYWNIPKSIAKSELIPKIMADDDFIKNNEITIYHKGEAVDPSTIDWNNIDSDKYSFRHGVNAFNPMGAVKFIFPNKYDIYIHDTPTKHLFDYTRRSASHGCIRLNEPFQFAEYLLHYDDKQWTKQRLQEVVGKQEPKTVRLKESLPVVIYYWTVYKDENGLINFREDIYGWDEKMMQPLNASLSANQ